MIKFIVFIIALVILFYYNYRQSLFFTDELLENFQNQNSLDSGSGTGTGSGSSNEDADKLFEQEKQLMQKQVQYYSFRDQTDSGLLLGYDNHPDINGDHDKGDGGTDGTGGDDDTNPQTQADEFYAYDETQPPGKQLKLVKPFANQPPASNVDIQVAKCKKINSCAELDGTSCGYCFSDNKFYYGDNKGPYTSVCTGTWVTTNQDCIQTKERNICEKVKDCNEMVGEASICGWCPTKNKAMVAKSVQEKISLPDGTTSIVTKLVPKYPSVDQCSNLDTITNQELGLVSQTQCSTFGEKHPCIGVNENTGPHSLACLQKLWATAGGTPQGTAAPQNNQTQRDWWNQRGWKDVLADMKQWVANANSNNWDLVKTHYKGVYGKDPDPCSSTYSSIPLECYQKLTVDIGCTTEGLLYPSKSNVETWPNNFVGESWAQMVKSGTYSKNDYSSSVSKYKKQSTDTSIPFDTRNYAHMLCYGSKLAPPPPIKVGDKVSYTFNYPTWGGETTITGYVCEIDGTGSTATAKVYWEEVINKAGDQHVTRSAHLDNPKIGNVWLGSYCGQSPEMFKSIVPASVNIKDLMLLSSCNSNIMQANGANGANDMQTQTSTVCAKSVCSMQNIAYIYYPGAPGVEYSVPKSKIDSIMQVLRKIYDNATICTMADIQYLVDSGLPYCACGWILDENGKYTSVYPSVIGTSKGCGGGAQRVISCGDDGPSWSNGLAGIYVRITAPPDQIIDKIKSAGFGGAIVATVGKNEYTPLAGVGAGAQSIAAPPPAPPLPNPADYQMYGEYIGSGWQSLPVKKIIMEGSTTVFMIEDGPYTKIIKQSSSGDQEGYYYVGKITQYGTKPLTNQRKGEYNVRKIR